MMVKTSHIHIRVHSDTKKKLKLKAEETGLDLTHYLEKVAEEDIIFLDKNSRVLLQALNLKSK